MTRPTQAPIPEFNPNRAESVKELFDGPVREFSMYNNRRMIPSIVDGFKISQRKVIYGTLKKAPSITPGNGIKVAQLANFIAEITHYDHGEGSLSGAIVGLAQNFPGTNNINYLQPIGQFGNRLSPAAGADRYIFTDLNPIFRKIFIKEDDLILEYLENDGDQIEPKFYYPILPNVLINGNDSMGTGHASSFLQYNPEDLKRYILAALKGGKPKPLVPWFRGYTGEVTKDPATKQVTVKGKIEKVNSTTLRITELPPGTWEENYKQYLYTLEDAGYIKSFQANSTSQGWDWVITVPRTTGYADDEELVKKFKLVWRVTENFTVWLPHGKLKRFSGPEELIDYFIDFRLDKYEERRQAVIKQLEAELVELNERLRWVKHYTHGDNASKFSKKTKVEWQQLLADLKFTLIDQLMAIPLYRLTRDEIEKLEKQITDTQIQLKFYRDSTNVTLYVRDLEALDLSKELRA